MKKYISLISFLIVALGAYWGFYDQKPITVKKAKSETEFSVDKALGHLKNITEEVHHVGTPGHKNVQNYLVSELQKMGLNPTVQTQTVINRKWVAGTTVENVLARIKGTQSGKALLLLSHYDSNPNIAIGASDAGSGVVTILETVRAFLAKGEQPKNDIIILISDAEELGLLGAKAFVEYHPWAKDVGLVLNLEARGSGGPSYMLMETNGKNYKLISEFKKANTGYPASNSLLYSIYKKLPNDTDLTVFREEGNINGFNFAFIGDHFDYHTMQDTYERLDRTSLAHQADYLTKTVEYFANADLSNLNSDVDYVYVNFPIVKTLIYPFSWVNVMQIIALVLLLILVFFGTALHKLQLKEIFKGFIPAILSIVICGGVSFALWKGLLIVHPDYNDMLHGFTYNGYWYIAAFAGLNLWLAFKVYKYFTHKENIASLFVAPIVLWLIINFIIPEDFKGAGFLIIPVLIAELILAISIFTKEQSSKTILFAVLSIPTVYIISPLIKMFPVGLGLKMLFISGVLLALLFGLLIPILNASKSRKGFTKLAGFLALLFFIIATYYSGFTVDKKKPNSLVYVQNVADSTAYWGTYNQVLDAYIEQKLGENPIKGSIPSADTKSKYNTRFSYHQKADYIPVAISDISIEKDTLIEGNRILDVVFKPQRKIRKLEFSTKDSIRFHKLVANTIPVNGGKEYKVRRGSFLIYHFGNQDSILRLQMTIDPNLKPEIIVNEVSDDLLENAAFNIQPRSEDMMPMPFVTNNAIISTRKVKL